MAAKTYPAGRGPIVYDHTGVAFRLGVDNDGNVTQTAVRPLMDDDVFSRIQPPQFLLPGGAKRTLVEPFFTPPETADPAGTAPTFRPNGTANTGQTNARPPLIAGDGQTFYSNIGDPEGPVGGYSYSRLYSPAWWRIHAKTAHAITLDTQLGTPGGTYGTYNYYTNMAVFEGGTANHGTPPATGYYAQAVASNSFYGYNGYGYYARITFTPTVGHYYFVCTGNINPSYYVSYGYAAQSNNNCLRWAGINQ